MKEETINRWVVEIGSTIISTIADKSQHFQNVEEMLKRNSFCEGINLIQ